MTIVTLRLLMALGSISACSAPARTPAPDAAAAPRPRATDTLTLRTPPPDSVRGKLYFSGSMPAITVSLRTSAGEGLRLGGLPRNIVRQLAGLELVLFGTRQDGGPRGGTVFMATDFQVRGVAGDPAVDGILRREGGGDVLELRDGRRLPIRTLPPSLAGADGKHVWIGGPALDQPTRAGIIDPELQPRTRRG